jgi:hypothetical protein
MQNYIDLIHFCHHGLGTGQYPVAFSPAYQALSWQSSFALQVKILEADMEQLAPNLILKILEIK